MNNRFYLFIFIFFVCFLLGCSQKSETSASSSKIGLLLENTIDDQGWNSKGYQGLLNIHSKFEVDVVFKENIDSEAKVERAVEEFAAEGVTLVFGHGHFYAEPFTQLGKQYDDLHFVSFNGSVEGSNVTSLHFDGYAMGFFAGLIAAKMSETHQVGVIAAFPWQSEVEGFYEGASLDEMTTVRIDYVEDWANEEKALDFFNDMVASGVDVFYPTGDGFHVRVVEETKREGLYVIGYVSDQLDLGGTTVLTSTIQKVDGLYELIANQYQKDELIGGNFMYDFADGVISLGPFGSEVPEDVQKKWRMLLITLLRQVNYRLVGFSK
ncbi:BMP family ABC transporter substrate-binding protein [Halalkalibacter hemicellulosilyticus]|uniref:Positive regulator of comK n=1 Tax=Halalkalibacter hemicellulosilyticusJCM 9152 TaxID=1236971 RepID=W4QH16_9BACI|nr:BMP family ABC transporter substrate-binding protein [Halalkalibacter hemicellulosilyticus]GAE31217.1 positive regulator of comK [Halalkalibacter hemicellulosilyticusJCM 9152]